jgi:hypothetical protein
VVLDWISIADNSRLININKVCNAVQEKQMLSFIDHFSLLIDYNVRPSCRKYYELSTLEIIPWYFSSGKHN